jgi:hypothetical protein
MDSLTHTSIVSVLFGLYSQRIMRETSERYATCAVSTAIKGLDHSACCETATSAASHTAFIIRTVSAKSCGNYWRRSRLPRAWRISADRRRGTANRLIARGCVRPCQALPPCAARNGRDIHTARHWRPRGGCSGPAQRRTRWPAFPQPPYRRPAAWSPICRIMASAGIHPALALPEQEMYNRVSTPQACQPVSWNTLRSRPPFANCALRHAWSALLSPL